MPTYDYQCQKCGFEFEREQRITEDPIKTCPECKSRQAKRLLSAPNFILKGGGWYKDGYGSSQSDAKPDASASTDASSGSDSSGGSSGSDSPGSSSEGGGDKKKGTKQAAKGTSGDKKSKPSGKSAA